MNLFVWLRCEWDRVAAFFLVGLGALFLFLGYQGMKDSPYLTQQMAYLCSGGLGGIFCLGLGIGLLLSADLHDEWRKLDRIEAAMRGEPIPDPTIVLTRLEHGSDTTPPPTAEVRPPHDGTDSGGGRQAVGVGTGTARATLAVPLDWRRDALRRGLLTATMLLLAPAAAMAIGWRTAARTADLDIATRGVAVTVAGLVVALAVIGLYLLWLRSRTARREARLFGATLLEQELADRRRTQPRPAPITATTASAEVMTAPGLRRFHLANCPALDGIAASAVPRDRVGSDLAPCRICGA